MFRGMSEPGVWIESERIRLLRGPIAGRFGEMAMILGAFPLALGARSVFTGLVGQSFGGLGLLLAFGAPFATFFVLRSLNVLADGPGAIGVVDGDLVVRQPGRLQKIPLAELVSGRSSPRRGEVEIGARGGRRIIAAVASADEAERLLVAAGLDASKRTMRFELGETTFLTWMTFLLGPAAVVPVAKAILELLPLHGGAAAVAYCVLFVALFAAVFQLVRAAWGPAKLIVGADGIVVDRALRDEFVPFSRLTSVTMKHDCVSLSLDDGSRVRARARHLDDDQQGELRARIDAAIAAFHRGDDAAEALSQLDRGGRAIDAWRASLHALLDRQGTYREVGLTREQLLAVLESPAAPAERRVAAAVSLSAAGEPEIATRIRVAAEACARPQVRIALAGVAEGEIDDAAIASAIAEDEAARASAPVR
jgi:hypothetical protein